MRTSSRRLSNLRTYLALASRFNGRSAAAIVAGGILAILAQLCLLATPYMTRFLIDDVVMQKRPDLLAYVLIAAGVALLLMFACGMAANWILYRTFRRGGVLLRRDLFDAVQRANLPFHVRTGTGEMNYRILHDASVLEESWLVYLITVPYECCLLLGGICLLLLQWQLALVAMLLLAVQTVVIVRFRSPLLRLSVRRKAMDQALSGFTVDRLARIQLIRSYGTERYELRGFLHRMHALVRICVRSFMLQKFGGATITAVSNVWVFGILWYGGSKVIAGEMTLGALMAFLLLTNLLYQPVTTLTNLLLGFQDVQASMMRVLEYLALPSAVSAATPRLPFRAPAGRVELRGVSFAYNEESVLRDVNLVIEPGRILALVGPSGAGKTTICRLIARFMEGYTGRILIDGCDLRNIDGHCLRRSVLYMVQSEFVLSGTVWENLTYGLREAPREHVDAAVRRVGLGSVLDLPEGYDTAVGEGGIRLSGGEAQRVALARALLHRPKVLILDEPTSNVDPATEAKIFEVLTEMKERCTIVVVAHRPSIQTWADRVVVIAEGRVMSDSAGPGPDEEAAAGVRSEHDGSSTRREEGRDNSVDLPLF